MSVIHGKCSWMLKLGSKPRKQNMTQTCFMFPYFVTLTATQRQQRNNTSTCKASIEKDNKSQPLNISVDKNQRPLISGSDVVKKFYDGINRHDIPSVEPLISVNCVYEDLIFPTPFVGRKSILEFFGKFIDYVSTDLQFVIDAISEEDSLAVGVTWHLEWKGRPFPFSKGCSFYQLAVVNDTRQIIYARDSVEPAVKPGESALIAIRGVVSCVASSAIPMVSRAVIINWSWDCNYHMLHFQ